MELTIDTYMGRGGGGDKGDRFIRQQHSLHSWSPPEILPEYPVYHSHTPAIDMAIWVN